MVYEIWQSSLLHVFVGYFRGRPCTKPDKIQKEVMTVMTVMYAHTNNQ